MKIKFLIILILVVLILVGFKKSFAQEADQCLISETGDLIRVGISTNDFSSLEYKEISITSDAGFIATDKNSNTEVVKASPKDVLKFQIINDGFIIYQNNTKKTANIVGPIELVAENNYPLQIVGLKRKGKQAAYRGIIEITKTPKKTNKLSVINVLPLEEYLRGVVPNELPVSFGLEALKAQAVAARNYALRPRDKVNPLYNVCDSVQSQVYFGANTESSLSDQAIKETKGLLALYDGEPILALYSSTAGGYTENYENAFSEPGSEKFPAKPLPYLKGKPDTEGTPCLTGEESARNFYTSSPSTFDNNSGYFRWTRVWTEEELRKELNQSFGKFSKSSLISPAFQKGIDIGKIKNLEVLSRGVSGKAIELCITTEKGSWSVKKELLIRRVLTNQGKALPSANIIFNNTNDENGNLLKIEAVGGGLGHGVGMSQYGAGFMSKNGYTFEQILQHYYDGVSIGTRPVVIGSENISSSARQQFFAPYGKADLIIENKDLINNFDFMINSKKISLNKDYLPSGKIRMPLDNLLNKGLNEIVFFPLEKTEGKNVKVRVEVFKHK
ncbi:MAG TPA: hypothetical protein DDW90_08965 [Cyanobacteria bacterium UBA9971]|nr:hypothetical protein [Cyanobacteria bacterium UBA9971]